MEIIKRGVDILRPRTLNDKIDINALQENYNVKTPPKYRAFAENFHLTISISDTDYVVKYLPDPNPLGDEIYFDNLFPIDFCFSSYEDNDFWRENGYMQIGEGPPGGGTSDIIDSKLSKSGQNKGGANVLSEDIPDGWTDQQIWDNVNEPWLRDAANRGDVIRVVSDPNVPTNIYKPDGTLSFFGREHEILTKPVSQGGLGYTYNPSTFTYTK